MGVLYTKSLRYASLATPAITDEFLFTGQLLILHSHRFAITFDHVNHSWNVVSYLTTMFAGIKQLTTTQPLHGDAVV